MKGRMLAFLVTSALAHSAVPPVRALTEVEYGNGTVRQRTAAFGLALEYIPVPDGVEVGVQWRTCGELNGFYGQLTHVVTMCYEALAYPSIARFIYSHEVGHAVIEQLDLPIVGSEEVAADEYAVWSMTRAGFAYDVMETALFFRALATPDDPTDPHPGAVRRAYTLMCQADGADPNPVVPQCVLEWGRLDHTWTRLLENHAE